MKDRQEYTITEKYWIIKSHAHKDEPFPLSYGCHFDKDDSAFKKRKETGEDWAKRYDRDNSKYIHGESLFIDNVPTKGFKISDSHSRYSTQNKWFDVQDPRGFTLQISASDLVDLINRTTIVNGVVQDEVLWARSGANNTLVTKDIFSKIKEKEVAVAPVTYDALKVGDKIDTASFKDLTFIGVRYGITLKRKDIRANGYWNHYNNDPTKKIYDLEWSWSKEVKKYYAFIEDDFGKEPRYEGQKDRINLISSAKIKKYTPHNGEPFILPAANKNGFENYCMMGYGSEVNFTFDDREHAKKFLKESGPKLINSLPKAVYNGQKHYYDSDNIKIPRHNPPEL